MHEFTVHNYFKIKVNKQVQEKTMNFKFNYSRNHRYKR